MAIDPRTFTVKASSKCPNVPLRNANEAKKRSDFFKQIGKIGDIEALNKVGASKVAEGLRTLAKISNSIRTGERTSAEVQGGDAVGPNAVFDAVGINPNAAQQAGQFNPAVLNRATAQAEVIYEKVKSGEFKVEDIPNYLQDLQNLGQLTEGIFNSGGSIKSTRDLELCGASPYAIDLIRYAPKYKFLFVVQIMMKYPYRVWTDDANSLAFVVKSSTRPNVSIEHEEINMYNFWTRVPKRVVYEPITMRFYDDNKGLAHKFYTQYLEAISPIARLGGMETSGQLTVNFLENKGMKRDLTDRQSSASLGQLLDNVTSIMDEIRVFHIYDYGKKLNVYHYHHPKILAMNLDDLDMADNGNGNEIELQFAFDALHITPDLSLQEYQEQFKDISGNGGKAMYPINPVFGLDQNEISQGTTPTETDSILDRIEESVGGLVSNAFTGVSNFVSSVYEDANTLLNDVIGTKG